jgi:cytochrome c-type biogenesis protein CcmH
MLWIAIALLTGLAALSVLWPISRNRGDAGLADAGRAFYQDQIAELERDRSRGLLSTDEYSQAVAEAGRRLIAVHDVASAQSPRTTSQSVFNRRFAAVFAIAVLPAVAIGIYVLIGKPNLSDRPLQARLDAPPGKIELIAAVAKIERRLANTPGDVRGWQVIAPVYVRMKRYDDAVKAWKNVIRLSPPNAEYYAYLGEAMVFAASGKVTPAARQAFDNALKIDPNQKLALYASAIGEEQSGNFSQARAIWEKLIVNAPPGAAWAATIRERIAGYDKASSGSGEAAKGPASAAGRAIAALPAAERQRAIRAMVVGLAARLEDDGKDINGWLRLIRAYSVLKDNDKAEEALKRAQTLFAGNQDSLGKLAALSHALGVKVKP